MLLLKIIKIVNSSASDWKGKDLLEMKEGQRFVRFVGSNLPDLPQYGTIEVSVEVLAGDISEIQEILFFEGSSHIGKVDSWKKKLFGGYILTVDFNTIFQHGLTFSTSQFVNKGGGAIGLNRDDRLSLKTIEGQRNLLSLLAKNIIPSKCKSILDFAIPGYILNPIDSGGNLDSHFVGFVENEYKTDEGIPLTYVGSMFLNEFSKKTIIKDTSLLSFFIKIQNSENGWPENADEFKVVSNKFKKDSFLKTNGRSYFNILPILDIPQDDHTFIRQLKLTKEEQSQYFKLTDTYQSIVLGDLFETDLNKFLGYAQNVQNCVAYEAERISQNLEYSEEIYETSGKWQLLLQVNPYCEWLDFFDEFGDGAIYYMIKKRDLEEGNFDNVQVVVQNT